MAQRGRDEETEDSAAWPVPQPVKEVDIRDFDVSTFYANYVDPQQPLCIRRAASHWSAAKWTPDYFASALGDCRVPVSMSLEEQEATRKTWMPLAEFVALIRAAEQTDDTARIGVAGGAAPTRPPYMKQFDILAAAPPLRGALRFWEFFSWKTLGTACFWLGVGGAVTGLHNDDENNVLAQFYGRKRLVIFPPEQQALLYVNNKYDSGTLCCSVDPDTPEPGRFPLYRRATPFDVVLAPGDVLFVPRYWFHYVKSLETSISVNYFASTPWELLRDGFKRLVLHVLHALGLYKWGNCVCHSTA